jgi:hypothetical protein
MGDEGVAVLAECLGKCVVEVLDLRDVEMGAAGCRALAQHLPCSCVKSLCLSQNRDIRDAGVGAVAERLAGCGRLRSLDLSHIRLGDDGCRSLVQGILGGCVDLVNLTFNGEIGDAGAAAIQIACTIRDELEVLSDDPVLHHSAIENTVPCHGDVVVVVDVIFLSGILPWLVAHPVFCVFAFSD